MSSCKRPEKCKHDFGWASLKPYYIFIYEDGRVEFNFNKNGKMVFECNLNCGKVRNVYLKGSVKKAGRIRRPNSIEKVLLT